MLLHFFLAVYLIGTILYVIDQMVEIKDFQNKSDEIYLDRIEDNGYFMNLYYQVPEKSNLVESFARFKALRTKEGNTYRLLSADMCTILGENNQKEYCFTLDGSMAGKDFSLEGLEIELDSIHKTSYGHEIPMNKENKSGVIINSSDVTSVGYNITLSVNGTIDNAKNYNHSLVVKFDDDYHVVRYVEEIENEEILYEYDLTRTEVEELTGYSIEWMYEELENFKETKEYDLLHNYISAEYETRVVDEAIKNLYFHSSISIKAWEPADVIANKGDVITYSNENMIIDEVDDKKVEGFYECISYYNNGGRASFSIKEIIDN